MSWRVDIGIDELAEDSYSVIVYDELTGDTIATVYGNSIEEVSDRAEIIANSN